MKNAKITAISTIICLFLCACANLEYPENSDSFSYTKPTNSFDGEFVNTLSFDYNDSLNKAVESINGDVNYESLSDVFNNFNANNLYVNKSVITNESFDKYDYDPSQPSPDIGNFDIISIDTIQRDTTEYKLFGTLTYNGSKTIESDGEKTTTTYDINNGVYSLNIDFQEFKIYEKYDYHNEELNKESVNYLSEINFKTAMDVTNNEEFLDAFMYLYAVKEDADNFVWEASKKENNLFVSLTLNYQLSNENVTSIVSTKMEFEINGGVVVRTFNLYQASVDGVACEFNAVERTYSKI